MEVNTMTTATAKIKDFVKDTVDQAQSRIATLEKDAAQAVRQVQDKIPHIDRVKSLDELLERLHLKEMVRWLSSPEAPWQGSAVQTRFLDTVGLVRRQELETVQADVDALKKELHELKRRTAGIRRTSLDTIRKQVSGLKSDVKELKKK